MKYFMKAGLVSQKFTWLHLFIIFAVYNTLRFQQ